MSWTASRSALGGFSRLLVACLLGVCLVACSSLSAQNWVEFIDETATRLVADPALGVSDIDEKDYAWGDIDQDGDIDLVCVRKEPFTTPGGRVNVLFLNEGTAEGHPVNGVLVDRTAQYASASDVAGDQGFQTPTNDRDVALADVNGDGWLDVITAVTLSDNLPKHLKMPRVYINLGLDPAGAWLGFEYRDAWIPDLSSSTPAPNSSPRFCSLVAADLTGDGLVDLYLGDYDATGVGPTIPMLFDYNDRLLVNQGGTSFADETVTRFVGNLQPTGFPPQPYHQSTFSASVAVADMNDDGKLDLVKQSSLQDPRFVAISYGNPTGGNFNSHDEVYNQAAYFVSAGDLNNDGLNDIVVVDDFQDRYLLNNGVAGGMASFTSYLLQGSTNEFGGNSLIVDLDNDGWNDVIVTDVDVDIPGCNRRMRIFHNLANAPVVTLIEQPATPQPWTPQGVHDAAVFDLNGDGWLDMVLGTCTGTQIWMNDQPPVTPAGIVFSFSQPPPTLLAPGTGHTGQVTVLATGGGMLAPGSVQLHLSVNGGPFVASALSGGGTGNFTYSLPAAPCGTDLRYYFSASLQSGPTGTWPEQGPADPLETQTGLLVHEERFETVVTGWTVASDPSLASGAWEQANPVGTTSGGQAVAPSGDAGPAGEFVCFVTENGPGGGAAGNTDVDGGPTRLTSPLIDLDGTDARIDFDYWMVSLTTGSSPTPGDDQLVVEVTADGGLSYVPVATLDHATGWRHHSFVVGDFVTPTATVRVRFSVEDENPAHLVEAALDNFQVTDIVCAGLAPQLIRGDVNADGSFNLSDPVVLLGHLFSMLSIPCRSAGDANDDGALNLVDAVVILNSLFAGGGPLAAPFGTCGEDPTPDNLGCDTFVSCP